MSTKPNLLIIGSSGFIASHFFDSLSGYKVSTFDRTKGFDILDEDQVEEAIKSKNIVLHFAAHAVGRKRMAEKPDSGHLDILGLKHIVRSCARNGAFLVFPSSSLVYGSSRDKILTEDSPCFPIDPYGSSKLDSEITIAEASQKLGLKYVILRLTTVYGSRMPNDTLISIFMDKAQKGEDLTIMGPGMEKRNFIYVDDVVSAIQAVLNNQEKSTNQIFNIGSKESVSLRELAESVIEATSSKSKIKTTADSSPPDQFISVEKAKNILGWNAKVSLKEGLKKFSQPARLT